MNILYKTSYIIEIFGIFPFIILLFYSILQLISHKYLGGFMRNLLSSKERRQLELMEFLVTSHEWIHLKSLAEKFLCTERILKQDLAELREIFPQVTIHSSTNGIRAHFSKEASIEDIYRHFLINSQTFSLLEYIFFHEGENISEVSNAFYTTPANLYRIVSKIVKESNPHYQFQSN